MSNASRRSGETSPFLQTVQAGRSREAVERAVHAFSEDVYRFAASLIGDRDAAEDITQETFVAACRSAPGFKGTSGLKTWLLGIARHLALNWIGRERPKAARAADVQPALHADASPSSEEAVEDRDLAAAVWERIGSLPPAEREILALFYGHDLSCAEIAKATGKSPGAVRVAHFRALGRLREMLGHLA